MSTRNLIDAIASGSALNIESAFEDTMAEKVSVQIEAKRLQIAQTMFTTEEVDLDEDQIDELDTKTLKSYVNKNLKSNGTSHNRDTGLYRATTKIAKTQATSTLDRKVKTLGNTRPSGHKNPHEYDASRSELKSRGIHWFGGERTKTKNEEVDLDEEQLDELGPETTVSYINKATKDAHATIAAANAGGDKDSLSKRLEKRKSGLTKAMTKIVRKAKEEQEEQE